ncbi:PDGLE domain-containing protein [Selenomonadales bacterium OttesenSCG-928-I06]|nr:PDGLE domain-containing protein [Selenomonadales bacterium OttesenSCG-928-I06]
MYKKYIVILLALIIISPLGLIAEGTAWGEWGSDDLKEMLGFVPVGIEKAENLSKAIFPDYTIPFLGETLEYFAYILSAIIGAFLVYSITFLIAKLSAKKPYEN